jgi:hypothetical protein
MLTGVDSRQMVPCHPIGSNACWTLAAECHRKSPVHTTTTGLWFGGTGQAEQMQNLSLDAIIPSVGHLYP